MALSTQELESKLWGAADILRGQIDSSDYKNCIFSMLFPKRLSDRFAGPECAAAIWAAVWNQHHQTIWRPDQWLARLGYSR